MIKGEFKGKVILNAKRVFKWLRWRRFQEVRRLSDHRAMSKALYLAGIRAPLARGEG